MMVGAPPAAWLACRLTAAMALSLLLAHQPLRAATAQEEEEVWPAGSAMAVGREHVANRDRFAALLETRHAALLASLAAADEGGGTRLIEALRAQHRAWLLYRVAECEVAGALTGAGGSWPSTYAVACEAQLTERRYRRVGAAAICVRGIASTSRQRDAGACLRPILALAPR